MVGICVLLVGSHVFCIRCLQLYLDTRRFLVEKEEKEYLQRICAWSSYKYSAIESPFSPAAGPAEFGRIHIDMVAQHSNYMLTPVALAD